ncbi:MAG: polysaccharide pyruvyl transferase family protein [Paraglaciecola sp.]
MKTVLIVNECASDNIGDHAISFGVLQLIRDLNVNAESAYFSTKKSKLKTNGKVATRTAFSVLKEVLSKNKFLSFFHWFVTNISRVYQSISKTQEAVILGGGQLLLTGRAFPVAIFTWVMISKLKSKNVYILGVGCGEKFSWLEKRLISTALKNAKSIYVREHESVEKLSQNFGVTAKCCPDLAFGLTPLNCHDKTKISRAVVSVTDISVHNRYAKELNRTPLYCHQTYIDMWFDMLMKEVNENGVNIEELVFSSTTESDARFTKMLYNRVVESKASLSLIIIDEVQNLDDYRRLISESNFVFSGRMHTLILAKIEGVRIVPWIISKKIDNFLLGYGRSKVPILRQELQGLVKLLFK